ncbi:MAG: patatin-like phospholipase family protein [Dysgonamonadaceae bacterium]|jgi:NTE family protein|nr:patatin-like phospholipase family protein [Dysgonamonadaceae bacterium]
MKFLSRLKHYKYQKGLVLSGGGARGIAHLGTAKALYEAGEVFDVIVGTSMGAIVGCLLADKQNPDDIIKLFTPKNMRSFIRPLLSNKGMLTMDGARKMLKAILTTENIEDLSIPFMACATNLSSGRPEYFESGNIIDAVIASAGIPVVFAPAIINNNQYVDGGVLNNLPVRKIRNNCKKIIGSHVNPQTLGLENGQVLGLIHIADRAFHLCIQGNTEEDREMCDLYLEHTNLNDIGTFDFNKADEIFRRGYENTKRLLNNNR